MTDLLPIRRQIVVPGTPTAAFKVFTADIGSWWPIAELRGHDTCAALSFLGGRLAERGPAAAEAVWGTVLEWDPPERLRMTWHPEEAGEIEVQFVELTGDQTLLTVEQHRGHSLGARTKQESRWSLALDAFADWVRSSAQVVCAPGPVWLVLLHTGGPALLAGQVITAHPDFPEHIAFLQRLNERGVLVAAGPVNLGDVASGMTVMRVPDPVDVAAYVQLAQEDDQAVVKGLLQVQVQPWRVALRGS
jgi:uncharacterized protein YciI/uncharacterized protein YndB with AHSA1/START domain